MAERWRPVFFRWLKFSAVGWVGVSVQLTVLTLLAGRLEMHYLVATAIAVQCAILNNFFWHERWTWGDRGLLRAPGRWQRFLRFNASSGTLSILGNVVFMSIYVGQFGLHYLIGNIASIASCTILNFVISDRLVFLAMPADAPASCE
jgi:dolichol-phosphate mannosyltransferase